DNRREYPGGCTYPERRTGVAREDWDVGERHVQRRSRLSPLTRPQTGVIPSVPVQRYEEAVVRGRATSRRILKATRKSLGSSHDRVEQNVRNFSGHFRSDNHTIGSRNRNSRISPSPH